MSDLAFSDVFPPDHNRFVPVRSEHEIWQKLAYECAQGALYDSSERPPFSRCLPGTRVDLLNTLSQAAEEPDPKLIWLCGDSGSGKSAVAHSIAECMREKDVLAGTFFFSRTNLKCNNTHYLFPTIAYQLGLLHPRARDIVVKAIKEDPALLSIAKSRRDQFEKLVVAPLRQLRYSWKKGKVIVLDAFEEGTAVEEVKPLVDQFLSLLRDELIPVSHIILTSRPYAHIDAVMRDGDLSRDVRVVRLDEFDARDDISTFLSMSFKDVHTLHRLPYPDPWPSEEEMKVLQSLAGGRFIIAATIIRLMSQGTGERPTLHPNVFLGKILDEKLEIVDQLYHSILTSSEDAVRGSAYLSPLAALAEPIHLRALSALLCADMHLLLQPLASVIVVPPPESELKVHIFHDSFRDFLSQSQRCKTMFVEPAVAHAELACACLRLMIQKLRRDICALGDSSKLLSEIDDIETKGDDCIPQALRYACQYWAYHLQNARADAELVSLVFEFLTKHVLHSVEVLALLEQLDFAATSLFEARRALLKWQPFNKKDVAIALLYDAHRLVLEFFDPISISPLHIYESALPLCPTNTKLRRYYAHIASEASILAVEGIDEDWDCITRVIGADSYVTAVAVSPDGSLIASASENRVHMWDSTTGTLIASAGKQPHLGAPLVFSPCYPMLAYCCDDGTWTVWDFERDVCVELVEEDDRDSRGGRYQPSRCAIAPDGRSIACARKTHGEAQLAVWNIESGPPALVFRYRVHTESQVVATSFSNQGDRISFVNLDDVSILSSHTGELLSRWRLTRRQFFPGSWHCFTADDRFLLIVDDISVTVTSVDGSSQRTINTFTSANPPPRSRLGLAEMRDWFKRLQLRPSNNPLALVQPFLLNNAVVAVKAADSSGRRNLAIYGGSAT
ncbi:hypothetical protein CONPUDRAFT_166885 [Coniophora puteana RWD-64-598 SS2]|uniref:Nephrocystin 3-like N-terminal domain-containing protein n=1 Tax=Coniophora puteana (strain RWD-64-598) TaxID=741705 RepID=A0A5M3MIW1_CONPW|nr:uncharacterized protein CONPUDRAFT_166885 [Coniophora puteana RWD-64-598 SS2]EIW79053.1 hypothetical protein CONPUDRAFT_166885 [Coniophora puteana RWD-64-598 SS2]